MMKRIPYLQDSRGRYLGKAIKIFLEVKEKQVYREFSF